MKKINAEKSTVYGLNFDDRAKAIPLIGQYGYFSDSPDNYAWLYGKLTEVYASHSIEYTYSGIGDEFEASFKYFAPESSAVLLEKEQRPYCFIDELPFSIGDTITMRAKDTDCPVEYLFSGYSVIYDDCLGAIIDSLSFTRVNVKNHDMMSVSSEYLMDRFDIQIDGEWQSMSTDA